MKKAKLFLSALFVLIAASLSAQNVTVAGKISDSSNGEGAAYASVVVKGTTLGTIADVEGNYSLSAPANGTLVFSSVGYVSVEVPINSRRVVNVVLVPDTESLEQVVVTAQGLTRKEKAIGYSTVKIDGEDLTLTRSTDLGQSLAGKVSGARFFGTSGATFDSGSIVIRGTNSYTSMAGSEPIYVVDGTITNKNAVNMDDIENVNILKGPAATALYGSQGGNGAVIITTRRAVAGESRIEFSHTIAMERFYNHFNLERLYGGGNYGIDGAEAGMLPENAGIDTMSPEYLFTPNGDGSYRMDYWVDENWGPRYDPKVLVASPLYFDPTSPHYMKADPWVHGLELGDLFRTGWTNTTNVAFSKAVGDLSTRVSFTNSSRTGISPNSDAHRRYLTVNSNFKPTSWFRINLDYKFTYRKNHNAAGGGYDSATNQLDDFTQWAQGNVNLKDYLDWQRPDGTIRTWNPSNPARGNLNPQFHDNPYALYNIRNNYSAYIWNVITGDAEFSLPFNIKLGGRVMGNLRNYTSETKTSAGTRSYTGGYSHSKDYVQDMTYQGRITWGDYFVNDRLHVDAAAFVEQRDYHYTTVSGSTAGGLTLNHYFNLAASKNYVTASNSETNYRTRAVFGNATASWDDTYFLDLSLRNDWDSRLPSAANSYLYGGASVSVMLSQLIKADWLRYWKLRASVAQVGSTLGAYETTYVYGAGTKYNSTPTLSASTDQLNEQIKPTISTSYEVGTEFRLFDNRLRGDINLYRRDSKNQIINVSVAPHSGFSTRQINAGLIRNQGIEIELGGTPVKTRDFSWDIDFNIAKNVNTLVELYPGMEQRNLSGGISFNYTWRLRAVEGHPIGDIITNCRYVRDDQGRLVLFPTTGDDKIVFGDYRPWSFGSGFENQVGIEKNVGNYQPKWTGGFSTSLRYKSFSLAASFDYTIGGKIISVTNLWGESSGMLDITAAVNDKGVNVREPVAKGGGVRVDGVDVNGNPLTTYVNAHAYYYYKGENDLDAYVYDRTYLKMREIALNYSLPRNIMAKVKGISAASVSLIATNPWLIYSAVPNIDPSESGSSATEGGQAASTRSFGLTLKLTF